MLLSGALKRRSNHAFDQTILLVPVGLFVSLEPQDTLGNAGRIAGREPVNFVVEARAFGQHGRRSGETDWTFYTAANCAHYEGIASFMR